MSDRLAQHPSRNIVGAARAQVAEEGLRGLSVRKVAARAGTSRGGVSSQTGLKAELVTELLADALAFRRAKHARWLRLTAGLDVGSANVLAAVVSAFLDEAAMQERAESLVLCELVAETARRKERHADLATLVHEEEVFWRDIQRDSPHAPILGWAIANYCRDELPAALALHGDPAYRLLRSGTIARLTQRVAPMTGCDFATGFEALADPSAASTDAAAIQARKQRPREICRAIAELIHREGVSAVTHRSVAAGAGIAKSTIAHHFRTREDLLRAGLSEICRQLTGADPLLFRGGDPMPDMTLSIASHAIAIEAARDPAFLLSAFSLRKLRGAFITEQLSELLGPGRTDVGAVQAAAMVIVGAGLALHLAGGEITRPMTLLDQLVTGRAPDA